MAYRAPSRLVPIAATTCATLALACSTPSNQPSGGNAPESATAGYVGGAGGYGGAAGYGGNGGAAGSSGASSSRTHTENAGAAVAPIVPSDFATPLSKAFLQSSSVGVSTSDFVTKWSQIPDALGFMRSFVIGYTEDMKQVPDAHVLGAQGLCFGDPHYENFGFFSIDGQTIFGYTDLEDSGYCPVSFDAARFFATLRLACQQNVFAVSCNGNTLVNSLIAQYVATLGDPQKAVTINSALAPVWSDVNAKQLSKYTKQKSGVFDYTSTTEISPPTSSDAAAVTNLIDQDSRFGAPTVMDVAYFMKYDGGSAGLNRYWALAEDSTGYRTILEFKSLVNPAVDMGKMSKPITNRRWETLEDAFWGTHSVTDFFEVTLLGGDYLERDRSTKKALDFTKVAATDVENALMAEVSVMASQHRDSLTGVSADTVTNWLTVSSTTIADRWSGAFSTLLP